MFIENINGPEDLKKLDTSQMINLAKEMRATLINKVSVCGGHLASNLGIVEITIGLHYVFDAPKDKIIFDVSHQTYCHKMLTGRKDAFLYPDKYNDVCGYSNPQESEYDLFNIGHTSTSISLACGMAKSRDLLGQDENVIAVIGDASLDGGQAFEALNYGAEMRSGLIVVVNDNDMSIPENHGILNKRLNELKSKEGIIEDNYFKSLGYEYIFVKDGHDINSVISAFQTVKGTEHPVVVHIRTQKGKGYGFAEENREKWHWAHPFDVESGEFTSNVPKENYGRIASEFLLNKMSKDPKVIVVAASTPLCIGFNKENRKKAGNQFVDVGIAEQNAISFSTGLAKNGARPVFATNSTFYQRAYDQIEQEMCISKCPVTMIVTHASVFGHANDTHHGLLDIALLGNIPGLVYLAPANKEEYLSMLEWSIEQDKTPIAIRVPWTGVTHTDKEVEIDYSETKYLITQRGAKVAILALGGFYQVGEKVAELYERETGVSPTLINPRFITGLDKNTLDSLGANHDIVVTIEDGIVSGGFGARISQYYSASSMKVLNFGFSMNIPNRYIPAELMVTKHLTPEHIVEDIQGVMMGGIK